MNEKKLTVGSLFSGIGGIELGLERTGGFETKWFCENDPYARAVLRKHWPGIPCHPDIRGLGVSVIPEGVDMLCGGFPCQDISTAGKRVGIKGERSGLFFEVIRLAGIIRPRYILLENVAALAVRGLDTVLGELALCGYDAEWDCISAASVGARHRRDRLFIVAYSDGRGCAQSGISISRRSKGQAESDAGGGGPTLSDSTIIGREWAGRAWSRRERFEDGCSIFGKTPRPVGGWEAESSVGRTIDGIPSRVDRLRCLGNAVVPQVAQYVGQCILDYERRGGG